MEVFTTNLASAARNLPDDLGCDVASWADVAVGRLGLKDGEPFLLGADGSYDHTLNRFLREAPMLGVRARSSRFAYARNIAIWARFLDACGKSIWEATHQDIARYRDARMVGERDGIAPATWNQIVASLDKLYRWALEEGQIDSLPFRYTDVHHRKGNGWGRGRKNLARDPQTSPPPSYIGLEDFLVWRDVGLRGFRPEGLPDSAFRGRNVGRNVALAEFLATKGTRVAETLAILTPEIDWTAGEITLPGVLRKNDEPLSVGLTPRLSIRLNEYIEIERAVAVERGTRQKPPFGIVDPLLLLRQERGRLRYYGARAWTSVTRLSPSDRRRVILVSPAGDFLEPAVLFLTERGTPLNYHAAKRCFDSANERCRRHGLLTRVTPHVLRHTFAVNMLQHLIRTFVRHVDPGDLKDPGKRAYIRAYGEPLRHLQRLLGHRRIASTYIYLDYLDDARRLVDEALLAWDEELDLTHTNGVADA